MTTPSPHLEAAREDAAACARYFEMHFTADECATGEAGNSTLVSILLRARTQAVEQATAAERERCARVAENLPTDWRDGTQPGPLSAYRHATREIASKIRSGQ